MQIDYSQNYIAIYNLICIFIFSSIKLIKMENTEIKKETLVENEELLFDKESISYLRETRKWTMFFAVLGFVFIGLLVIFSFVFSFAGMGFNSFMGGGAKALILILYLGIGILYFFPIYYLLKFSVNMKKALEQKQQNDLNIAFKYLKSHYKFVGILTIVVLSLYVLIGVFAAIGGISTFF